VRLDDTVELLEVLNDIVDIDVGRRDSTRMRRVTAELVRAREDEQADADGDYRVDPVSRGQRDDAGADEHAHRSDGVGDDLEVGTAQVEALLRAGLEQPEADQVDQEATTATTIIGAAATSWSLPNRWIAS